MAGSVVLANSHCGRCLDVVGVIRIEPDAFGSGLVPALRVAHALPAPMTVLEPRPRDRDVGIGLQDSAIGVMCAASTLGGILTRPATSGYAVGFSLT
jgi:hypothetical protein